jgi:uncharacterized membrane protein YeaQ/YmgE (transglycosylase-associated protein family)
MGIIAWIIIGGLAGWVASKIMKTDAQQGIILNIVVGIVGALLGGFIGRALNLYGPNDAAGFLMSTFGAIVLLWLYRLTAGRRPLAH